MTSTDRGAGPTKTRADDASGIESRMAGIRGELRSDAERLERTTRRLFDWTAHVRDHPWVSFGVVAAIAYYLVPKRGGSATERGAKGNERSAGVGENPGPRAKSSFLGGLTSMVTQAVLRGALDVVGHEVVKFVQSNGAKSSDSNGDAPSREGAPPGESTPTAEETARGRAR